MADIFLSYNREDAAVAKLFAEAFAREGLEVWWDATLRSGEDYDKVTEAALHEAKAVVVLWSPRSVDSRWVRAEATVADQNKTLMPVTIEACRRPVMFELKQTADLSHWRGAKNDKVWLTLLAHVRQLVADGAERAAKTPLPGAAGPVVERTRFWRSGRNRIAAAVAAAVLIVGAGIAYEFMQPTERAPTATAPQPGAVSLAVLPLVNLSSDKEQEFFSDGMTEEITSALAKVSGLNVVARTSAFQFKGENPDIQSIARALHATHVIKGSVSRAGDKVRIRVQLIKAADGTLLWTENYNRDLKDVFAVQEEIATAIAGALRVPLGLTAGRSLVANRTADTDSYQDYLRARALVRGRGLLEPGGPLTQAATLLEKAVARDPGYAPARGMLAYAYALTPVYTAAFINGSYDESRAIVSEFRQKAETAAQRAIRLDPNNQDGYLALGQAKRMSGAYAEAEDFYKRALSLDPGNPDVLHAYSIELAIVGRVKEAVQLRRRLQAQEPYVPQYSWNSAQIFWVGGANEEAIALMKAVAPSRQRSTNLANFYASMGRYNEAADSMQGVPAGNYAPGVVEEAMRLLRSAPAQTQTYSSPTVLSRGQLGFFYVYAGSPDRALDFFEGTGKAGGIGGAVYTSYLWARMYAPLRTSERFKALVRNLGLVEYWRAKGWPELCHPTTGDDFECQ